MSKFFIGNKNIEDNKIRIVNDYNHIKNVLRKNIGDTIEICNKETSENFLCEITSVNDDIIGCNIIKKLETKTESKVKITVYQGLPKSEKMELVIQKCVELGAYEFIPVEMKNCVVKLKEKDKQKKIERWQKISEVAAKQCGRNIIPKIENVCTIKDICNSINRFDSVIVAYENEENYSIKSEIEKLKQNNSKNIAILIGPEGGFDKEEIDELKKAGAKIVTLGKRILRTETVGISLTSILMYELGDLC